MMAPPPDFDTPVDHVSDAGPAPSMCRFWIGADYLFGWLRPDHLSTPLVTTGGPPDFPQGALGQPNTSILFGDKIDYNTFSGVRIDTGVFLDHGHCVSLDWRGDFYATSSQHFAVSSDSAGNPLIARPAFNAVLGSPTSFFTASPGVSSGGTTVDAKANFLSTELNAGCHVSPGPGCCLEAIVGFRYLYLSESLAIQDTLSPLVPGVLFFQGAPVGLPATVSDLDQFRTRNYYYGSQVGARFRWDCSWLYMSGYAKIGVGATEQTVDIRGISALATPTTTTTAPGGILALPSNIGHHNRTVVSFVPDTGLNVGVKVTSHIQLLAGYSFLFWNSVVRPGRQIDPGVNPSQIPTTGAFGTPGGPARPVFLFNGENVWMQTLSLGVLFQY
jgi:hypothetical protein